MSQPTSDVTEISAVKSDTGRRRIRLREFQMQLVERMQAVRTGLDARSSQLGVQMGDKRWLLNLQEAGEIISIGTISPVPLTQDWYLGLTNVRGNLIGVIDLARFHGHAPTRLDENARIIAFAPNLSFNCGLLVSRVMGLRDVAEMRVHEESQDNTSILGAGRCYVDRESQQWNELSLAAVVQDEKFLHVGL